MNAPENLIHEILPVGMLQCNCHILGDPWTREAIVIDPGDDAERILEVIDRHHLKVAAILITHTHIDHVVGLHRVHAATGAPVYVHSEDLSLYRMLAAQATWLGWKTPEVVKVDQLLREGDVLRWGGFEAHILHTPGHTPGSICIYMPTDVPVELPSESHSAVPEAGPASVRAGTSAKQPQSSGTGRLFAGDTLFAGSIGRTDLWGGSFQEIIRSLKGKLLELPDNTLVFPGHGGQTTIGEERAGNPFLREQ